MPCVGVCEKGKQSDCLPDGSFRLSGRTKQKIHICPSYFKENLISPSSRFRDRYLSCPYRKYDSYYCVLHLEYIFPIFNCLFHNFCMYVSLHMTFSFCQRVHSSHRVHYLSRPVLLIVSGISSLFKSHRLNIAYGMVCMI